MIGPDALSPDININFKNEAIQLSLNYASIPSILSSFTDIQNLLSSYGTLAENLGTTPITYLNSISPYELGQFLGVIYTPLKSGVINDTPFVTSKNPSGILFEDTFTPIDDFYTKNVSKFTTLGVGSGLIEISPYTPPEPTPPEPTPPEPTPSNETGLQWYWWVLIIIGIILVIAIVLYYFGIFDLSSILKLLSPSQSIQN